MGYQNQPHVSKLQANPGLFDKICTPIKYHKPCAKGWVDMGSGNTAR